MSRRKKPNDSSPSDLKVFHDLEYVSNIASRSDKVSWNRKMENLIALTAKLTPIEEQILELMTLKMPIMDELMELRNTMVEECVHPFEYLVHHGDYVHCKFCNKNIRHNNDE